MYKPLSLPPTFPSCRLFHTVTGELFPVPPVPLPTCACHAGDRVSMITNDVKCRSPCDLLPEPTKAPVRALVMSVFADAASKQDVWSPEVTLPGPRLQHGTNR